MEAARKERLLHKETKEKLDMWNGYEHEEVVAKLDRIPELEAAAADKIDEEKLEQMAEARALTRIRPLEREANRLKEQLLEKDVSIEKFTLKDTTRTKHDAIRAACKESKDFNTNAVDDALLLGTTILQLTEEGKVQTEDGMSPDQWLSDIQSKRSHWWEPSVGGGARDRAGLPSGIASNPFTNENWNMTEQSKIVKEHGMEKATQLAKAAGTVLGVKPPPKK